MANTEPLLSLKTTVERKSITIDGKRYAIRSLEEFSLIERHRIATDAKTMAGLDKLGDADSGAEAVQKATDALKRSVLEIIVDGQEIVEKLNDENRLAVINCFFEQVTKKDQSPPKSKPLAASKGSTEELRKIG